MRFVQTEISIDAPRRAVWRVLLDFARYPEWNRFIRRIDGAPEVGSEIIEHIHFDFLPFPVLGKSFIQRIETETYFSWQGSFVHALRPLGYGTHSFALLDAGQTSTHLVHREEYRSPLIRWVFPLIRRIAEPGFRKMDLDLKARAEALG